MKKMTTMMRERGIGKCDLYFEDEGSLRVSGNRNCVCPTPTCTATRYLHVHTHTGQTAAAHRRDLRFDGKRSDIGWGVKEEEEEEW